MKPCITFLYFSSIVDTNPPGKRTYTAINNPLTWKDAQTYCRTYHTDLAMIENAQESTNVTSVMSEHYSWIGLYREPWKWSDNSRSSFRNWQSGEPNNYGGVNCVAETSGHFWIDMNCDTKLFFWCYKGETIYIHLINAFLLFSLHAIIFPSLVCGYMFVGLIRPESEEDHGEDKDSWSWIGLNDDPKSWKGVMGNDANSWRWSATGETSETDYQNWYPNEPNNRRGCQKCVFAYRDGRWMDEICHRKLSFVCFNGKNILCLMI
uniref:C-type lectin domain-containing protein n=1 Tax=Seriola lalandi dorsalis TaxID=1841481 RepID=A0A3B4XQ31_SERLL